VDFADRGDSIAALSAVDKQLKSTPNGGIGYGILRSVVRDPSIRKARAPRIIFNYRTQAEEFASESAVFLPMKPLGEPLNAWYPAQRLQNWRVSVRGGQLWLFFNYHEAVFRRSTMQRMADGTIEAMRSFIAADAASA
jgi:non-ribosomal peptide synthase protein (TIGR01720 family)